jgi:hypothetical protein
MWMQGRSGLAKHLRPVMAGVGGLVTVGTGCVVVGSTDRRLRVGD